MMRINKKSILMYADEYDRNYDSKDEMEIKRLLKKRRYLGRRELLKIGMWKSKRPRRHYKSKENDNLTVKEITKFSFKTRSEKARIESLQVLKGVSWPVPSAILHFAFPEKYPIMDFRVIWSLGWKQPSIYDFSFWQRYCVKIHKLSKKYNLPIRTVEKSLWKYSKEHQ